MSDSVPSPGQQARFEALCGPLRADLYRFAFWLARDRAVAEDVVQDALLRAWRSFASLGDEAALRPWLLTIARREFARRFERKSLETVDVDDLAELEDPALAAEDSQEVLEMRAAIFALDRDYREPLVLQVLMGYSTEEIATHMELTPGAVLTRLFRARQKLKVALLGGSEEP
ncbi:MAG TPA: sigma-70 family RNA polymerase sigma factor [Steroidobacteraceae bacterium]|nr:sigma-70 family RNA polymerase sigma factor [Steroidobacteraceae bacterium]